MDFGNLFTDWESKLCDNSNKVERRSCTQLPACHIRLCPTESQFDFSSSQIPRPLPADTHERLHEITIHFTTVGLAQARPNHVNTLITYCSKSVLEGFANSLQHPSVV